MELIPVPRGMCPAFYQIMGAGGNRSESGEILMLRDTLPESKPMTEGRVEGLPTIDELYKQGNGPKMTVTLDLLEALLERGWSIRGRKFKRMIEYRGPAGHITALAERLDEFPVPVSEWIWNNVPMVQEAKR